MVICKYKIYSLIDGKFEECGNNKFKTYCPLDAYKVINKWNKKGCLNNYSFILWFYEILSFLPNDPENNNILFRDENNC